MGRLFTFIVFCIAIVFAVVNKTIVPVIFWPFPYEITMPLSLLIFFIFFIAFICGAFFMRLQISFKKKIDS